MSLRNALSGLFKSREEFDLTSGGIGRPLLYLSLPIVITNLFQTAYNLADTFWLGQYSTDALAAISFAFPMVFLLISLALGLSVAGSVLVAQHVGAGEEDRAEYAASQTVTFSVIASLVLGVIGYFAVDWLIQLLGASEAIAPLAAGYMRVFSIGLVFVFGFAMFIALMRGYGDTITPMLVMFGSVVINIVLDPLLIFGFESNPLFGYLGLRGLESSLYAATGFAGSGIEGAAIATIASRALAFVVALWIMFRGERGVQINLRQMVPDLSYARRMLSIGLPASVEGTVRSISINLLLVVIATFPTTVVAAYGIGTRIFSVVFLPAIAFSQGVETMTGQNIGADEVDRAGRTNHFGAVVLFVVLSVIGAIVWLGAAPIVSVFTTDPAVVDVGATFLRYSAPTFGFIGIMRAYTGGFRGAGMTMIAAVIAVGTLGLVRLPIAWLGAGVLGVTGLWLAFPISNVVGGLISYFWFRRGSWRNTDLTSQSDSIDANANAEPAMDD
ncbi:MULTISPECIES: MATE family efflux transporter [Halococcus]|uniref:MATE efflux family protein n=1 Tax=Halococcus salifodinae DSM 8989 TaxID=1227456 RepID=M0MSQ9_9EURY|nr:MULTISPECIES: MATE family efflux transporter [Halococcus]EMA48641.1 MATE efflux family protein [Halococcus salifodinae DSM 8989]